MKKREVFLGKKFSLLLSSVATSKHNLSNNPSQSIRYNHDIDVDTDLTFDATEQN